jgi:transposase
VFSRDFFGLGQRWSTAMMGRQVGEAQLFYIFSVDRHVPTDHLLRRVDAVLDLSFIRTSLAEHYSHTGRPSIDPELMIRMLLVGYLYGIRSETRLCEEVHLNLAYRWFCRLGLDSDVPERSSFSKNRHGRFREGDLFRRLFEEVVRCCVAAGLVGGTSAAVDGSVFNLDGEPIVESPKDAIDCFLRSELDAVVMGDFIVRRAGSSLEPLFLKWASSISLRRA